METEITRHYQRERNCKEACNVKSIRLGHTSETMGKRIHQLHVAMETYGIVYRIMKIDVRPFGMVATDRFVV